jgi:hypothetical protein
MVPNSVVLGAAVVPVREPETVDVRVRLGAGMRPTRVQALLDEKVKTPTRDSPRLLLEEVDGDALVVRIRATPENALDGVLVAVLSAANGVLFLVATVLPATAPIGVAALVLVALERRPGVRLSTRWHEVEPAEA